MPIKKQNIQIKRGTTTAYSSLYLFTGFIIKNKGHFRNEKEKSINDEKVKVIYDVNTAAILLATVTTIGILAPVLKCLG